MSHALYFDDSLPVFAAIVTHEWGQQAIDSGLFLRDAPGRLTFVVLGGEHPVEDRATLALKVRDALGQYADGGNFSVSTPEELFDDSIRDRASARKLRLTHPRFTGDVYVIDRRVVGADWLRDPVPLSASPPRFVFASFKGGVGRSTSLCVLAAHLAGRGRRVLAVDLDLEAPGLGNMLLPGDTLPEFGLLDWLVENGLDAVDDQFYADMVGPSWLGGGRGRVDVIPAIGRRSLMYPANVLAKLARAYLGGSGQDGGSPSFADNVRALIDRFADPVRYDAILVDARAGLHETTAAAVLTLGAHVLCFGADQSQTFAGYELLLAHLASFPIDQNNDWRERIQFVQAKASIDSVKRKEFAQRMDALLRRYLWPMQHTPGLEKDLTDLAGSFEVEWSEGADSELAALIDEEGPLPVLAVLDDERFRSFDPVTDPDALTERAFVNAFQSLLEVATELVDDAVDAQGSGQ